MEAINQKNKAIEIEATKRALENAGVRPIISAQLAAAYESDRILESIEVYGPQYGAGGIVKSLLEDWQISVFTQMNEDVHYPHSSNQRSRRGYIYFLVANIDVPAFEQGRPVPVKIGRTINLFRRLENFNTEERTFQFVKTASAANYYREEMRIHGLAADLWIEREWFNLNLSQVDELTGRIKDYK